MKIEVNITKGRFFVILGAILLLTTVIGVYAYNAAGTGGVPSVMGHSVDEIDWSKPLSGLGLKWGNSTVGGALQGDGASIELAGGWPYIDFKTFAAGHNPDYDVRLTSAGTNDSLFLQGGSFCFEDGSCKNSWNGVGSITCDWSGWFYDNSTSTTWRAKYDVGTWSKGYMLNAYCNAGFITQIKTVKVNDPD